MYPGEPTKEVQQKFHPEAPLTGGTCDLENTPASCRALAVPVLDAGPSLYTFTSGRTRLGRRELPPFILPFLLSSQHLSRALHPLWFPVVPIARLRPSLVALWVTHPLSHPRTPW